MIINIRGTSGSGKSTVVREIMRRYPAKAAVFTKDRKRPVGYVLNRPDGRSLFVVGHYETDCGGCDTIPNIDRVYQIVDSAQENGMDVLFEGLLISAEFNRTRSIHDRGDELVVVGMQITLEDCLASINQRRDESWERRAAKTRAYNEERQAAALARERRPPKDRPLPKVKGPVSERNTRSKWVATQTTMRKLQEAGVAAEWHDRESAVNRITELLKL